MNSSPLVSIIVTSYNYGSYIGQTIESVLQQTYQHWELIISDDGSQDHSVEIITSFVDDRITLITSPTNVGAAAAYEKAYQLCKGKYLCSLDSDDFVTYDRLSKQVHYLEQHPDVDILRTFINEVDPAGQVVAEKQQQVRWFNEDIDLNSPEAWFWWNHLCHSSILMKRSVHERVGFFDEKMFYAIDHEFWLRCWAEGLVFDTLKEKLTSYRVHSTSVSARKDSLEFCKEYAFMFCTYIRPQMLARNRADLAYTCASLLINHDYTRGIDKLSKQALIQCMFFEKHTHKNFRSFSEAFWNTISNEALFISQTIADIITSYQVEQEQYWHRTSDMNNSVREREHNWQTYANELQIKYEQLQGLNAEVIVQRDTFYSEIERLKNLYEQAAHERDIFFNELENLK